jgi:hypothetical protein
MRSHEGCFEDLFATSNAYLVTQDSLEKRGQVMYMTYTF